MSSGFKWIKSQNSVTFSVSDRVAAITLNRPDKRNVISGEMMHELRDAILEADDRLDVNVIVLCGAGKDFCAGYDLADVYGGAGEDGPGYDPKAYRKRSDTLDNDCWGLERQLEMLMPIFDIHKPIIAKVQGNCLAGGMDLAMSCDLVIAADDAKVGFPAARANGTPAVNWWMYHCGPQWTKRMLFTGDILSGADAARIGLVLDAVPADELDAEVAELARRISFVDAELLSVHKRVVNLSMELAGARTLQRMASELDARGHLSQGDRRRQFRSDMAEQGLKVALTNRDAPFGKGRITLRTRG